MAYPALPSAGVTMHSSTSALECTASLSGVDVGVVVVVTAAAWSADAGRAHPGKTCSTGSSVHAAAYHQAASFQKPARSSAPKCALTDGH